MNPNKYLIAQENPTVGEFLSLRRKVGWGEIDSNLAKTSLNNSLFCVVARSESKTIGMGRVVGDGAMYFYVQDIIVDPNYQCMGVGAAIMENIERYLLAAAQKGATIGLLSAKGKEEFYVRYSYILRPSKSLGNGMCKFV